MGLVIFDCDGVLVESEAIHVTAELAFLSQVGLVFDRDDYMRRFMGLPPDTWEEQLGIVMVEQLGKQPEPDFFEKLDAFTMQRLKEDLVPVEGACKAIKSLDMVYAYCFHWD